MIDEDKRGLVIFSIVLLASLSFVPLSHAINVTTISTVATTIPTTITISSTTTTTTTLSSLSTIASTTTIPFNTTDNTIIQNTLFNLTKAYGTNSIYEANTFRVLANGLIETAPVLSISEFENLTPISGAAISNIVSTLKSADPSLTIKNTIENVPYGFLTNGQATAAGNIYNYSVFQGNTLTSYKITLQKASPNPCITTNLEPAPFCGNATTPIPIHPPLIRGKYGISGSDHYPLNITFSASLLGGNSAPFNFTVTDLTNNTTLTPLTQSTTNSILVHENFSIPVTHSIEITFSTAGNANYSKIVDDPVILPSNIVAFLPIVLTNYQNVAIQPNTPLAIGTVNTFTGNVIGFNAIAYQQYETCNLNNAEFFFANGMLINSWLEGNMINEQAYNAGCSSAASTNALAASSNVLYWVNAAWPSSFLPANTGTPTENTIYIGWAGNFISTPNTLMDGVTTGEAPQLSSTYGALDNGWAVFNSMYTNFKGASAPSGWTVSGAAASINNGANIISGSGAIYQNNEYAVSSNAVVDGLLTNLGSAAGAHSDVPALDSFQSNIIGEWDMDGATTTPSDRASSIGTLRPANQQWFVGSMYWFSSSAITFYFNYGANELLSPFNGGLATNLGIQGTGGSVGADMQWIRVRPNPPSGILAGETFGNVLTSNIVVSLVFSNTPTVYGTPTVATATCQAGDTCAVQDSLGNTIASATTTEAFAICPSPSNVNCQNVGSHTWYANDLTTNQNAAATLSVVRANVPLSCTLTGSYSTATTPLLPYTISLASGSVYNDLNASDQFGCTITTIANQVTGNLWKNTAVVMPDTSTNTVNALWDNNNDGFTFNALQSTNYNSNSINFNVVYSPYLKSSVSWLTSAYETSNQAFTYIYNITKFANTVNSVLTIQTNVVSNSLQTVVQNGLNTFPLSYQIPLLQSNNIVVTANMAFNVMTLSNGMTLLFNPVNTVTQAQLFNYFPVSNIITPYGTLPQNEVSLVGDNVIVNTLVFQASALNQATLAGLLQVGCQSITESLLAPYTIQGKVTSFVANSGYCLPNPTLGTPTNVPVNSVVQLSFNSNSVYRNVSTSFWSYNQTLLTCSPTYPTNTLQWVFYDGTQPATVWTKNVLVSGFFNLFNNLYTSNTILGTSAGFTSSATSNTYNTCMYPLWSLLKVGSYITYTSDNSIQSQYYLQKLPTSNVVTPLTLYINKEVNPLSYEIFVENTSTVSFVPSLVKVLRYDPNSNSSILVTELKTTQGSGAFTYLDSGVNYKFQAYTPDGQTLLATTGLFQAAACATASCSYTIFIGNFNVTLPQSAVADINANCIQTPINANTVSLSCAVNSKSGKTYTFNLGVFKTQYFFSKSFVCNNNLTTSAGSLTCTVHNTNVTQFEYMLNLVTGQGNFKLASGFIGTQGLSYGIDGVFYSLILIIAFSLMFVAINPNMIPIGFDIGWVLSAWVGFITPPVVVTGGELALSVIILLIINR